jgi:hypothetical protein
MGQLLGPAGFCYPLKFPRIVYPAAMVPRQPDNVIHKDYKCVQDMFTTWVPLGSVPRFRGGWPSDRVASIRPACANDR